MKALFSPINCNLEKKTPCKSTWRAFTLSCHISSDFLRCLRVTCWCVWAEVVSVSMYTRACARGTCAISFLLRKINWSSSKAARRGGEKIKHLCNAVTINLHTHVQGCLTTHWTYCVRADLSLCACVSLCRAHSRHMATEAKYSPSSPASQQDHASYC